MCRVVIDAVDRLHKVFLRFRLNRPTRVRVAIKTREVGARHLQADTMPDLEDVGGGPQVEVYLVHVPWLQQLRLGERLAIASTQNTIREDFSTTIGGDIDEFACKVRIAC